MAAAPQGKLWLESSPFIEVIAHGFFAGTKED
jgi:hypothetical protein